MALLHLSITMDCNNIELVGAFWSAALGFDDIEKDGDYWLIRGAREVSGVRGITLQRVPEPKSAKNRMHLDLVVDDVDPEVERLRSHGAEVVGREPEPTPFETVIMADPEGNEFCVIKAHTD